MNFMPFSNKAAIYEAIWNIHFHFQLRCVTKLDKNNNKATSKQR